MSRLAHAVFILLLLAGLAVGLQPLWKRWLPKPDKPPAVAQPAADFGPCMDHRARQPDAEAIAGLSPRTLLFSSDCGWLISGNQNGSVQVIERRSGKLLAEAAGHPFRVEHLVISPDDKLLFSSSTQEDVMIWSLPELKRLGRVLTARRSADALAYHAGRGVLVTGSSSDLHVWKIAFDKPGEAQFSEPLISAKAEGSVHSLAFSPDGKLLAAGMGGTVQLWQYDGAGLKPLATSAGKDLREWIMAVAFTRDGKALVSGTRSKKIQVWQVPSLEPVRQAAGEPRWEFYTDPTRFTARPPRDYAAGDKASLIFEIDDAVADRVYLAAEGRVFSNPIAWRGLVQAAGNSGGVSFFDIYANRPGPVLTIPAEQGRNRGSMLNFAVLPERSLLGIKRGFDLMVIDLASLKVLKSVKMDGGKAELQWVGDGKYLAFSNHQGVGFMTVETGEIRVVPRPPWNGDQQLINLQIGASLDGRGVAALFGDRLVEVDPELRVKDVASVPLMAVQLVAPIAARKAYLVAGPDGGTLFGGAGAGARFASQISFTVNAALTPDGSTLYVKEPEGKICRYRIEAPAPCELVTKADNPGLMALDSDGRLLVEGGHKKRVRVLDLAAGKDLAQLEGHLGEIAYLKLLGNRVLSIDKTGELRLWSLESREALASARP
jgi:WD40 repeat protein